MHVSLAAETIFSIGGFQVTNALFSAIIISILLFIFAIVYGKKLKYLNPSKFQLLLEMLISVLYNMAQDTLGEVRAKKIFGFLFTFAFVILIFNWFGLLPFVPSISINESKEVVNELSTKAQVPQENIVASTEPIIANTTASTTSNQETSALTENALFISTETKAPTFSECLSGKNCFLTTSGIQVFEKSVHVFRAPTSDLSFTVAIAIISLVATNALGVQTLKMAYFKRFFNTSSALNFVIGIIEGISEFSKIISFSFRLFGNVFAGEMLLVVITSLTYGIATFPFLALELFVGVIQALVFFMLTTVFIGVAVEKPH